jgi:hypothetical protein
MIVLSGRLGLLPVESWSLILMHESGLRISHRGRDTVGGVVIAGDPSSFMENCAEWIVHSLIRLTSLQYRPVDQDQCLSPDDIQALFNG